MHQPFNLNPQVAYRQQNEAALAGTVSPDMPAFDDIMNSQFFLFDSDERKMIMTTTPKEIIFWWGLINSVEFFLK